MLAHLIDHNNYVLSLFTASTLSTHYALFYVLCHSYKYSFLNNKDLVSPCIPSRRYSCPVCLVGWARFIDSFILDIISTVRQVMCFCVSLDFATSRKLFLFSLTLALKKCWLLRCPSPLKFPIKNIHTLPTEGFLVWTSPSLLEFIITLLGVGMNIFWNHTMQGIPK